MDALLGNYGSDDDEVVVNESSNKAPVAAPPAPKSNSSVKQPPVSNQPKIIPSQVINVPGQKKRKLLDISILPDHIQKALIHGETSLGDSDDDEFAQTSSSKTSSAAHGGAKNASVKGDSVRSQLDPLLAMLPAPSNKEDVLDSMFSAPKTSTRAPPSVSHQESSSSAIEAEDLGGSVGLEDLFAGSSPPLLTRQFTSEPDSKSYTPQFSAAAYPEPAYQNDYTSQPSVDVHAAGESQRKRQRHLEQMLMAGDLSALQSDDGAVVQDIHIDRQWDMLGYTEQKQKEAAIFKQYTADGTLKAALQPSRQQNRKHQLTSMAMKAAETEIAMLDSQIAKSKTKTQTKSRYGW